VGVSTSHLDGVLPDSSEDEDVARGGERFGRVVGSPPRGERDVPESSQEDEGKGGEGDDRRGSAGSDHPGKIGFRPDSHDEVAEGEFLIPDSSGESEEAAGRESPRGCQVAARHRCSPGTNPSAVPWTIPVGTSLELGELARVQGAAAGLESPGGQTVPTVTAAAGLRDPGFGTAGSADNLAAKRAGDMSGSSELAAKKAGDVSGSSEQVLPRLEQLGALGGAVLPPQAANSQLAHTPEPFSKRLVSFARNARIGLRYPSPLYSQSYLSKTG
jgi:hypothetical protein